MQRILNALLHHPTGILALVDSEAVSIAEARRALDRTFSGLIRTLPLYIEWMHSNSLSLDASLKFALKHGGKHAVKLVPQCHIHLLKRAGLDEINSMFSRLSVGQLGIVDHAGGHLYGLLLTILGTSFQPQLLCNALVRPEYLKVTQALCIEQCLNAPQDVRDAEFKRIEGNLIDGTALGAYAILMLANVEPKQRRLSSDELLRLAQADTKRQGTSCFREFFPALSDADWYVLTWHASSVLKPRDVSFERIDQALKNLMERTEFLVPVVFWFRTIMHVWQLHIHDLMDSASRREQFLQFLNRFIIGQHTALPWFQMKPSLGALRAAAREAKCETEYIRRMHAAIELQFAATGPCDSKNPISADVTMADIIDVVTRNPADFNLRKGYPGAVFLLERSTSRFRMPRDIGNIDCKRVAEFFRSMLEAYPGAPGRISRSIAKLFEYYPQLFQDIEFWKEVLPRELKQLSHASSMYNFCKAGLQLLIRGRTDKPNEALVSVVAAFRAISSKETISDALADAKEWMKTCTM